MEVYWNLPAYAHNTHVRVKEPVKVLGVDCYLRRTTMEEEGVRGFTTNLRQPVVLFEPAEEFLSTCTDPNAYIAYDPSKEFGDEKVSPRDPGSGTGG